MTEDPFSDTPSPSATAGVRAAEPSITCTLGSYAGAGYGIHANIHNSSQVRAHELRLSLPTLDQVWQQGILEPDRRIRPQIPLPENSPLFTAPLGDAFATLAFKDRIGLDYALKITLEQTGRDSDHIDKVDEDGPVIKIIIESLGKAISSLKTTIR